MLIIRNLNDLKLYINNIAEYGSKVKIYGKQYETKFFSNKEKLVVGFYCYTDNDFFSVYLEKFNNRITKIDPLLGFSHIEFCDKHIKDEEKVLNIEDFYKKRNKFYKKMSEYKIKNTENDIGFLIKNMTEKVYELPENVLEKLFIKESWATNLKTKIRFISNEINN